MRFKKVNIITLTLSQNILWAMQSKEVNTIFTFMLISGKFKKFKKSKFHKALTT